MSIKATYKTGTITILGATIKLDRIWGSKVEGWNAWVNVIGTASYIPLATFSVRTEYVEGQNPYEALYEEVSKLPFLTDIVHDIIKPERPIPPASVISTEDVAPKKPKKGKAGDARL